MTKITVPGLTLATEGIIRPDPFSFDSNLSALTGTLITSANQITVTGTPAQFNLNISVDIGEYEINNSGTWTGTPGSVVLGDTVRVRHTSSLLFLTDTIQRLTIQGVSGTFTTRTIADVQNTILWDEPVFLGYSKANATTVSVNTIFTNVTSGDAPLAVHASASNVSVTGGSNIISGGGIEPYIHLEHQWTVSLVSNGSLSHAGEIINPNTLQAVDYFQEQSGGEAAFIFHEPGVYRISQTSTSANGATDTNTIDITVNVPTYAHKWFDPDFGAGGDGFDPHGFATTTATYTESSGELTQASAFTGYDHAAATSETYLTDNSNWIHLISADSGALGTWHRFAPKVGSENDTIILQDKIGTDQTNVISSDGPLNVFNPATDVAADTAHHFKVSRIYTISSTIDVVDTNGARFMGWGGSGKYTFKAGANMAELFGGSTNSPAALVDAHKMILDGSNDLGITQSTVPFNCFYGNSNAVNITIVQDRCKISNTSQNRVVRINQNGISINIIHWFNWACELDNRRTGVEATKSNTAYVFLADGSSAVVGTRFWGEADNIILDHQLYCTGAHGHRLRSFNDSVVGIGVGFVFNENCGSTGISDYTTHFKNRFRNADLGIDGSAANDIDTGSFRNTIILLNSFDGSDGLARDGISWETTTSAFIGHNIVIDTRLESLFNPTDVVAGSIVYLDGNIAYNGALFDVTNSTSVQAVNNITERDDDLTGFQFTIRRSSAVNGVLTRINDNQFWIPNDADGAIHSDNGTFQTTTTLNAQTNASGNIEANPNFANPATKDFGKGANVRFEVVEFNMQQGTVPHTQPIPLTPGFGTPKGVIMIQSADRTDPPSFSYPGSGYGNGSYTIGFSDGTNEYCTHAQHDSDGTPSSGQFCIHTVFEALSVRTQSTSNAGIRNLISASFGIDEITLNYIDGDSNGETFEGILIAIGGDDVDVVVGNENLGTGISAVPITTGHATDVLFMATSHDNAFVTKGTGTGGGRSDLSYHDDASISHGVAINNGNMDQMGMTWFSIDSGVSSPATNTVGLYNDAIIAACAHGPSETYTAAITAFTATGVEITPDIPAANALVGYMSLAFAGSVNMAIVDTTIPADTGNTSVTGAGFSADVGYWLNIAGLTAYNTPQDATFACAQTTFDATEMHSTMIKGLDGSPNQDNSAAARQGPNLQLLQLGSNNAPLGTDSSGYTITVDGVDVTMTDWEPSATLGRVLLLGVV